MRVVIGEDEALVREGLALVLQQGGFEVVAAAQDATDLVRYTEKLTPDLVITDIRMPPGYSDEGLRAALEIREAHPEVAIVVLSQYLQRQHATELLAAPAGGVGYLLKQRIADIATFCADLERVCTGGVVLDPDVVALMMGRARRETGGRTRLTNRQVDVLALMAEGRSNTGIARTLCISKKAVVQHTSHIYDELGIAAREDDHRRVLAVLRYLNG